MQENNTQQKVDEVVEDTNVNEATEEVVCEQENVTEQISEEVSELEKLKKELTESNEANKASQDKLLRLQADFDNYRRRTNEEQLKLASFVTANVVEKFLKVLDNFERAEESLNKTEDVETIRTGMDKIKRQFAQALVDLKVEEISTVGEKFNPEYHEALMRGENPELEDDTIDTVFEKGYKIEDRVIRPSKVKVVSND